MTGVRVGLLVGTVGGLAIASTDPEELSDVKSNNRWMALSKINIKHTNRLLVTTNITTLSIKTINDA